MHIGVIPGSQPYPSNMKVLDYGAARCLAVGPDVLNLRSWFGDTAMLLFDQEEKEHGIAKALEEVYRNPSLIHRYGEALHQVVKKSLTWDIIFRHTSSIIRQVVLDQRHKAS